jgi:predicted lipid-binding transport protein (Tim44 family)
LIRQIKKKDSLFKVTTFLEGATLAFEMILEAFAKNDATTLKKLLGQELYNEFEATIEDRKNHGETLETTLVKIESVQLIGGHLKSNLATLIVKFQTEQIHVTRDKEGKIIDGSPKQIEQLVDVWTFERDITKSNPNWILIKTSP